MAIKLLAFDDQLVAYFAAHKQHNHFACFNIIQGSQRSHPQFKLGEKIGAQALDRFRGRRGLVRESGLDNRFQDALLAHWQRPELPVRVLGDDDLERHGTDSASRASASSMGRGRNSHPFISSAREQFILPCRRTASAPAAAGETLNAETATCRRGPVER
jgi:hypothetical protein